MTCPGHRIIARGWATLPLCWTDSAGACACGRRHSAQNAGKAPLTPHGVNDATTDRAKVDAWVKQWPQANWGVACRSVTVIDIDEQHLATALANDAELRANHLLVATPGRAGLHIYLYESNERKRKRVLTSSNGEHVGEILRASSYAVGPGSQRGGHPYEALTENQPATVEDADQWVDEVLPRFGITLNRPRTVAWAVRAAVGDLQGGEGAGKALAKAVGQLAPATGVKLKEVLQTQAEKTHFSSPSEADYFVVRKLAEAGLSDGEITAVWRQSQLGNRHKVQVRRDYVPLTIGVVRSDLAAGGSSTAVPPEDEESLLKEATDLRKTLRSTADAKVNDQLLAAVKTAVAYQLDELDVDAAMDSGQPLPSPQALVDRLRGLPRGPVLLAHAPGLGKTHHVVKAAEIMGATLPFLHLGPSHKSFENVARSAQWQHWRGHSDGTDGRDACPKHFMGAKGYDPRSVNCECGAENFSHRKVPTFAPVEYALADSPNGRPLRPAAEDFDLWVFDDVGLDRLIDTRVVTKRDLDLAAQHPVEAVRLLAQALQRLLEVHTAENQGRNQYNAVHWPSEVFWERLNGALSLLGSSLRDWVRRYASATEGPGFAERAPWLEHEPQELPLNFAPDLFNAALARVFVNQQDGEPLSAPLGLHAFVVWDRPNGGRHQSVLRFRRRKYVPRNQLHKVVILDATADPALIEAAFGRPPSPAEDWEPEFPPDVRVVQLRRGHVGVTQATDYDEETTKLKADHRNLLKQEIGARKALGQAHKVGVITFKRLVRDCQEALTELGYTWDADPAQSDIVTGYYYNLRGANDFLGCDVLVLVGFPRPNPQGLYEEACVLFQPDKEPISTEEQDYAGKFLLRNGRRVTTDQTLGGYRDARMQALLEQKSTAELYQAFHRARPYGGGSKVREVLLITDVPVKGVPVDTFFGRWGRVFDVLDGLVRDGRDEVTVPQLVAAVLERDGHQGWGHTFGVAKTNLGTEIRKERNRTWLEEATGTQYRPGSGKGQPAVFRTPLLGGPY